MILDANGVPIPQYKNKNTGEFEELKGLNGGLLTRAEDGEIITLGTQADVEAAAGNGSAIALIKRLRTLLGNISDKVSTETKLETVRTLLETISGIDFASETKAEAIRALVEGIASEDFATDAKLEAVRALVNSLNEKDFLTNTTLGNMRANSAPVGGVKTLVPGVASELFAGTSRKAGRSILRIRNLDEALRCRIGSASISDTNGEILEPGATREIEINPSADVPVYGTPETGGLQVEVDEI